MDILNTFEAIKSRQSIRKFSQREIPDQLVLQLLELTSRAPSGFNLQPWNFIVIKDPALKQALAHVAMNQPQVAEAPVVVAFVADPLSWKERFNQIVDRAVESGSLDRQRAKRYKKLVQLQFVTGFFDLIGFIKKLTLPLTRLRQPTPNVITSMSETEAYVCSQTMLAVSTFLLAARSAGLDTCPMEGFDEYRAKRLLKVPKHMRIPVIVPLGYALEGERPLLTYRLPLDETTSVNFYPNKIRRKG